MSWPMPLAASFAVQTPEDILPTLAGLHRDGQPEDFFRGPQAPTRVNALRKHALSAVRTLLPGAARDEQLLARCLRQGREHREKRLRTAAPQRHWYRDPPGLCRCGP